MRWLFAIGLATAATYALRLGSVWAFGTRELPPVVGRSLRHAAIGLLSVLVVVNLPADGRGGGGPAMVVGLAMAVAAARRWENPVAVMAPAIAAYWVVQWATG